MGGKRQGREVPQSLRVKPSAKHPVWKTQSHDPKQNYQALKNNQAINLVQNRYDQSFSITGFHHFDVAENTWEQRITNIRRLHGLI